MSTSPIGLLSEAVSVVLDLFPCMMVWRSFCLGGEPKQRLILATRRKKDQKEGTCSGEGVASGPEQVTHSCPHIPGQYGHPAYSEDTNNA